MACSGLQGDYLCAGWRSRAAMIVARDGGRCRGCDRGACEVRLEVHHRRYGKPGQCGACVLTGVTDEDLVTLCGGPGGCHEAITNVRRAARYAERTCEPIVIEAPEACVVVRTAKTEVVVDVAAAPDAGQFVPIKRRQVW